MDRPPVPPAPRRQRLIAEARTWLHTPWHHHNARVRGAGVDCGQFLIACYAGAGLLDAIYDAPADVLLCQFTADIR